MGDHRVGSAHDARSRDPSPPAQLEILPDGHVTLVIPTEQSEQVVAHQGHATGSHEYVAHRIVLTLVDFSGLHPLNHQAIAIHALADVQQHRWVRHRDHLGGDDSGIRAEGLLDEEVNTVGSKPDIVVAQEQERCALHLFERLVDRRSEAAVLLKHRHKGLRVDGRHAARDISRGAIDHHQGAQFGIVLLCERPQHDLERVIRVRGNHHGDDVRRTGLHETQRLPAIEIPSWGACNCLTLPIPLYVSRTMGPARIEQVKGAPDGREHDEQGSN